jgi:hypothetical protein
MNYNAPPRLENETVDAYVERVKSTIQLRGAAKVIRPAHLYQLRNFEDKASFQIIQFIEKEPKYQGATEMVTINDGTTNEAVLEMLIDRCENLFARFPSDETAKAIEYMQAALEQFELRTLRRLARNVEGKHIA